MLGFSASISNQNPMARSARLVAPEEMGTLFKVLAVTGRGLVPAPWAS